MRKVSNLLPICPVCAKQIPVSEQFLSAIDKKVHASCQEILNEGLNRLPKYTHDRFFNRSVEGIAIEAVIV